MKVKSWKDPTILYKVVALVKTLSKTILGILDLSNKSIQNLKLRYRCLEKHTYDLNVLRSSHVSEEFHVDLEYLEIFYLMVLS